MVVREGQMQREWRMLMGRMMLFFFSSIPSICFSILYQSCNTRGYLSKTICFSVLAGICWFLYLWVARELFRANFLVSILVCWPGPCELD